MSPTVTANGLTLCHKGSNGTATSDLPDICMTPVGKSSVPINYTNVAKSADLVDGSETVLADGDNSIAIKGSKFSKSTGDEAGTDLGVSSGTQLDEAEFFTWSPDIKIEGKAVCRKTDKMFMNKQNSSCMAGVDIKEVKTSPINQETELKENHVKIYLVDDMEQPIPNEKIEIYNAEGKLVKEVDVKTMDGDGIALIDLSKQGVGVYYARYSDLEPNLETTKEIKVIDNKLYYPVEIQEGDTIVELGASKGFLPYASNVFYYSDFNKLAPNACMVNEKKAFETGQIFYVPLRRVVSNQITTHKIHYQTKKVLCRYDDEFNEPIRNRYVMFWEVKDAEDKFYKTNKGEYAKYGTAMDLPIGYGKTDEEGILRSYTDMSGFNDDESSKNITYNSSVVSNLRGKLAKPVDLMDGQESNAAARYGYESATTNKDEGYEEGSNYPIKPVYTFFHSRDGSDVKRLEEDQKHKKLFWSRMIDNKSQFKNKIHLADHQLVPKKRDKDENRVRFVWQDNLSKFPTKRKLSFMVIPADIMPSDKHEFTTIDLLQITETYRSKPQLLSKLESENPERKIFIPQGEYSNPVELYFRTLDKKQDFYSADGYYYYEGKDRKEGDINYTSYCYSKLDRTDWLVQLTGGYDLITEKESDTVEVTIPCTKFLPEWTGRIKQKAELLNDAFKEYTKVIEPHLASIAKLQQMMDFSDISQTYPSRYLKEKDFKQFEQSIQNIEKFQKKIKKEFTNNTTKDERKCKVPLENVKQRAKELFDLLESNDLKTAFDAYLDMVNSGGFEGWPYKDTTINWLDSFFEELAKACSALNTVEDQIDLPDHKENMDSILDLFADQLTQSNIDVINESSSKFNIQKIIAPENDAPIVNFVKRFLEENNNYKKADSTMTQISKMFSDAAGPRSLCSIVASLYGMHESHMDLKQLGRKKGIIARNKTIGRMFGYAKIFIIKGESNRFFNEAVEMLHYDYPLRFKKELSKSFKTVMIQNHTIQKNGNFYYSSFFAMFSIVSFLINFEDTEKDTLEGWIAISLSAVDTSAVCLGYVLQHYGKTTWYKALDTSSARLLGIIGVYCSIDAALESGYYGDTDDRDLYAIQAAGSAIFLLTGITSTGMWLSVLGYIGLIISLGIGLWFFIRQAFIPNNELMFDQMKKELGAEKFAYYNEYQHMSDLKTLFQDLGQDIDWSDLSWRAVVPLYESGYYVNDKRNPGKKDVKATVKLLANMGVSDLFGYNPEIRPVQEKSLALYKKDSLSNAESLEIDKLDVDLNKKIIDKKIIKKIISDYEHVKTHLDKLFKQKAQVGEQKNIDLDDAIDKAIITIRNWRTGAIHIERLPQVVKQDDGTFRYDCPAQL